MPENKNTHDLTLFEQKQLRRVWHKNEQALDLEWHIG